MSYGCSTRCPRVVVQALARREGVRPWAVTTPATRQVPNVHASMPDGETQAFLQILVRGSAPGESATTEALLSQYFVGSGPVRFRTRRTP